MTLASVEQRRTALAGRMPQWQPSTLDRVLARMAGEFADRPYVLTDEVQWSYAEVQDRAERFASGLAQIGVKPGDRVALLMANYAEFVPLAYAVWRLGATLIPMNFAFRATELGYVLKQSAARVLITMSEFRGLNYCAMLDQLAPGWERDASAAFPNLKAVVLFGATSRATERQAMTTDQLLASGANKTAPANPTQATDPAVIMYTSGTTGLPKGVLQSHDNVLRISYALAYHQAYREGRRTVFALPLYHAFGLVVGVIASIWVGGAIVPQMLFDPVATFAGIEKFKATDGLFVPTMAMALIEHPDQTRYDLSSLTGVLSGAAPTPASVWKRLIEALGLEEAFTGYGMTELSCATVLTASGDSLELLERTVGRIIDAGAAGLPEHRGLIGQYKTCDPYSGELLADGEEGELVFKGPTATKGYFGRPDETAVLFLKDGWLRSGDLGRIRPDGYIELTGRSKELYKTGGELVAPKEVEAVLDQHPDVAQSYVIGVPDDKWGEIGAAWVVPKPGAKPKPEELAQFCAERLAKYKWPRHVFLIDAESLPKTPTAKVQKFELVKMAVARLKEAARKSA
ncbi:MAG: class I adenylate-forming enzyme family protein [Rhodospirillales bacterium]